MTKLIKSTLSFLSILVVLVFITLFGVISGCADTNKVVRCYFDVINPETGEHLKYENSTEYRDAVFTYDGSRKKLEYPLVRADNHRPARILDSSTTNVMRARSDGSMEDCNNTMRERGKYYFYIYFECFDENYNIIHNMKDGVVITCFIV